ncbi:MAG: hypothetical protein V2A53_07975 [bacterium]
MYEIEEKAAKYILLLDQYGLNLPDFVDDLKMILRSLEEERLLAKHSEPFVSSCPGTIIIRDCDPLVTKIYEVTKPIFTKEGLFLSLLFVICSLWFLTRDFSWVRFYNLATFQFLSLVFFGISILVIGTIIHEFLHGLIVKKYEGHISSVGIFLFPFPSGFCDVTSIHFINNRTKRFLIYAIGVYWWLIIALFFALLCKSFTLIFWKGIFFYLSVCGIISFLVVLNPFTPSDGREAIREFCKKS